MTPLEEEARRLLGEHTDEGILPEIAHPNLKKQVDQRQNAIVSDIARRFQANRKDAMDAFLVALRERRAARKKPS